MSRTKGYKCFNIKCGSCIGKTLCGEPEDTALVCVDRVIGKPMTNADRIRAMNDEELNELFHEIYNAGAEDAVAYEWGQRTNSFEWTTDWLQQPAGEEDKHEAD